MKFLGIDGGGTKTEFLLIDEKGNRLANNFKPTSHYKQTSFANFKKVLELGINEICEQANITTKEIDFSFVGIPGYGEIVADIEQLESIVGELLEPGTFKCGNDSEVAWAGSLACQPGINLVAGTGSIGFGFDSDNNMNRAGGWGDLLGDEGSAYWIALRMLEIFVKQSDGRLDKTPIYKIVKSELNLNNDFDLLDLVLNEYERKRDKIACLAKILHIAAEANDPYAIGIYKDTAYENFLTVKALVEKMNFVSDKDIYVSYSGGVFSAKDYVLAPLKELLNDYNDQLKLIEPILNPASGAALYALILNDNNTDGVVETLKLAEQNIKE